MTHRDTPEFLTDGEIHAGSKPKPVAEPHIRWVGDVLWIGDLMFGRVEYVGGLYRVADLDLYDLKISLTARLPVARPVAVAILDSVAANFVRAAALAGMVKS